MDAAFLLWDVAVVIVHGVPGSCVGKGIKAAVTVTENVAEEVTEKALKEAAEKAAKEAQQQAAQVVF